MTQRSLDVESNGRLVGRLREADDLWAFEYAQEWISAADAFDLSPTLTRRTSNHEDGASHRPVQWYFDNLLPEEALRTVIAREADLPADDAFGLLAYYGAESAGSLVLRDPTAELSRVEHGLRPLTAAELSRRIVALPRESLTRDAPKRMSLAGAQHKMLVVLKGDALFEPLPSTPSTHILKPDHQGDDYPASVLNEFFTMRLARAVGLSVPNVSRRFVPEPVYVIERFDREPGADGAEPTRRHVIDTCQLLNRSRAFKYTSANIQTLVQALEMCDRQAAARVQLYRWLVFNLLVGNGDNHIKNLSFMVGPRGVTLAPAYDLLSTAAYDTRAMADEQARWPATALALHMDDARTFGSVTRSHLVDAARNLGLRREQALREIDRLVLGLPLEADRLIAEIDAQLTADLAESPNPRVTELSLAGARRLLRTIRHVVIADMVKRLG